LTLQNSATTTQFMLQQNIPHLNLLTRICQVANFRLLCVQVPLPITPDFVGIDCRLVRRPLLATMWCEAPMFTMIFGWVGSCIDNIRFCIECTAVGRVRVIYKGMKPSTPRAVFVLVLWGLEGVQICFRNTAPLLQTLCPRADL